MFLAIRIAPNANISSPIIAPKGQFEFTTAGTFNWTVPAGVNSISGVLIQGGSDNGSPGPSTLLYNNTIMCNAENFNRVGDGGSEGGAGGGSYGSPIQGAYAGGGGGGAGGYDVFPGSGGGGSGSGPGTMYPSNGSAGFYGGGGGGRSGVYSASPSPVQQGQGGGGVGLKGMGIDGGINGGGGSNGMNASSSFTGALFGGGYGQHQYGADRTGGTGGALSYKNNIVVTPGSVITVIISGNGGGRIVWGPGRVYPNAANVADV